MGCQELPPQLLFAVKRLLGAAGGGTKHKPTPRPAGSCLGSRSGGCRLPRACQNLQLRAPRCGVCASGGREGEAHWHNGVPGVKATTVTTETRTGGSWWRSGGRIPLKQGLRISFQQWVRGSEPVPGSTRSRRARTPPLRGSTTEDTWRSGPKNHHSDEVCRLRAAEVPPFQRELWDFSFLHSRVRM